MREGDINKYTKFTIKDIEKALMKLFSEEDLQPYKLLGNGLYELPENIICNEQGLNEYLKKLRE